MCYIIMHWQKEKICQFWISDCIHSHSVLKSRGKGVQHEAWLREDAGPKLVWHPQPLMNGTMLWVLWAPTQLRGHCFWTGAEPKQTREHQLRPPPACYTFNAPVVRNNPLCLTSPPAAAQHGAYMQYATAQDRAGAPMETLSGLTGQRGTAGREEVIKNLDDLNERCDRINRRDCQ